MTPLPSPYPVLFGLMAVSFIVGMLFYRDISRIVRRHVDRKNGVSRGQIK